ncbi:MAG: hypothetical protein MMC23_000146 [Stictis urceolatum]|nr:hypothetical protein [Stictis urceolata]
MAQSYVALATSRGMKKGSKKHRAAWYRYVLKHFEERFCSHGTDLENFQYFCEFLGITKNIETLTKCKKALKRFHVCIGDLIKDIADGANVQKFSSLSQLCDYIRSDRSRIFPKELAKNNLLLTTLLRVI